ncbi:C1q domain containing protein [uncultured Caudovirales phage]|uniref:C1q domain containing protein n=1 Tax=uncultured Caudovirales phage TaxID=2100421 RepID=A0A6J5N8J8_9CAUD|nr:C1q domain containing protein [uncultured Caudovirales phage]
MGYVSWSVVFGEQPSATKWNILGQNDASFNDGTGIAGLYKNLLTVDSNPYKFSAYRNGAWTDGSSAFALITHDTKVYDTNTNFTTANGRYTAPVSGFYALSANSNSSVTANSVHLLGFYKNGVLVSQGGGGVQGGATSNVFDSHSYQIQLTAGDYVQTYHYGTGGAGSAGAVSTSFQGFLISRT